MYIYIYTTSASCSYNPSQEKEMHKKRTAHRRERKNFANSNYISTKVPRLYITLCN